MRYLLFPLLLTVVGLLVGCTKAVPDPAPGSSAEPTVAAQTLGRAVDDLGNQHVALGDEHSDYNTSPPTSGPHFGGGLASAGIYAEPIPDEIQVHSLEDGYVVVQYGCPDECVNLTDDLIALISGYVQANRRVILGPYTPVLDPANGTARKIALTAWARIDVFDTFDEARIRAFIAAYEGIDHHR
ncbi:MAG: DUF3105 domain-containing protein [Chloroflexi bacterium]|nr:DUF3105 domain-containing protein [Chloroflexota bacterium]